MTGIGIGGALPIFISLFSDYFASGQRAKATAFAGIAMGVGTGELKKPIKQRPAMRPVSIKNNAMGQPFVVKALTHIDLTSSHFGQPSRYFYRGTSLHKLRSLGDRRRTNYCEFRRMANLIYNSFRPVHNLRRTVLRLR